MVHNEIWRCEKSCEKAQKRCEIVDIEEFSIKKQLKPFIVLLAPNHMIFGKYKKIGDVKIEFFVGAF